MGRPVESQSPIVGSRLGRRPACVWVHPQNGGRNKGPTWWCGAAAWRLLPSLRRFFYYWRKGRHPARVTARRTRRRSGRWLPSGSTARRQSNRQGIWSGLRAWIQKWKTGFCQRPGEWRRTGSGPYRFAIEQGSLGVERGGSWFEEAPARSICNNCLPGSLRPIVLSFRSKSHRWGARPGEAILREILARLSMASLIVCCVVLREWYHPCDTTCPGRDSYRNPLGMLDFSARIPIGIQLGTNG